MAKKRPKTLSSDHKLNARSLRVVAEAMTAAVRRFADEGRVRFRGRRLGNEAFINAAVWMLADLPAAEQERILAVYLPRLEAFLVEPADGVDEAPGPAAGGPGAAPTGRYRMGVSPADDAESDRLRRTGG